MNGEGHVSLFVAGAILGEGHVSLFVAGAVLGQVSLFVAGTILGEGQVSLFLAGAVFGEIWKDSRIAKCCIFQYKMVVLSAKSNLWCAAGCRLTGSCSDHARIGRALEMTFQLFSANFRQMLGGHFVWQAQYMVSLEGDICCSAHCKKRFICEEDEACVSLFMAGAVLGESHVSLFVAGAVLGEGQVSLFVAGAVLGEVTCNFSWQVQYLVNGQVSLFVAGAILGEGQVSLFVAGAVLGEGPVSLFVAGASLFVAAQYLVKITCHFSWQANIVGEMSLFVAGTVLGEGHVSLFVAGAVLGEIWKDSRRGKCCIFQYKMVVLSAKRNLWCAAGCGLTGSCSDHARIGRALEMTFSCFLQISARCWMVILRGRRSTW